MNITSTVRYGVELAEATEVEIKSEPMLLMADRAFAVEHGGPLTRCFLAALDWPSDILVDSRVHMLMPGMWPCIPGWHHDDVPRLRSDGQPDYTSTNVAEHCMALWGDCSLTEFAIGTHTIAIPPIGEKIYKVWNPIVEALCDNGVLERRTALQHQQIFFDARTWHRGMPTTHRGFRFFIRATRNSLQRSRNEIRLNANVYMPILTEGW